MKNKRFIIIAILYFILCIGNNLIHPITTPFLENYLRIEKVFFGYYFALMSLGIVVGAMVCGTLSNKISRKVLTCIGFVGYALFQLLFGLVNFNPYIVMIWRFFSGFFIAFPNTLFIVFASDLLEKEERVKGLTVISCVNLLGVAVGYEIGGLMHDYVFGDNFIASFILQVVWTLLGAIICFIIMDDKKVESKKSVPMFKVLKTLDTKQIIFFIALFMFSIGMISVSKFFEPFFQIVNRGNGSVSSYLAHFTTISNIVSILVMLFFIPIIKKYFQKKSNLLFTILLLVSAILVLIVFTNRNIDTLIVLFFTVYLLYIVVKNIMTPLEQNITIENSKEEDFTALLSFRQSILSFGQVLGPILLANAFSFDMHMPFFVAAGLFIVGFILMIIYLILNKKENKDASDNK